MKPSEDLTAISLEKAKETLDKEKASREKECLDKIVLLLNEYECQFDVSMTISMKGNTFDIRVIAK